MFLSLTGKKHASSTRGKTYNEIRLQQSAEKAEKAKKELEAIRQERTSAAYKPIYNYSFQNEDFYQDDLLTINYNNARISTTSNYQTGKRYDDVKGSFNSSDVEFNKNKNTMRFEDLALKGLKYDNKTGENLARDIASHSVGFTGKCSKYVRQSLERVGISNGHTASAYQMGEVLSKNKNFKEISPTGVNLNNLPAGCVLVYDRGAAGYNKTHGHIEVTLGDGSAASDGRTRNIRHSDNMRIFIPVASNT